MRVTIASRIYAPEPAAASFRLAALAAAFAARGNVVTVLTSRAPDGGASEDPTGVTVRRARVLRDAGGYVRGYLPYLSFDVPLFFRLLFSRRPDAVVVEPPPTTGFVVRVVCALRRVPYIYYAADVWADASRNATASSVVRRVVRWTELTAWRGARVVLSVSAGVSARLRELGIADTVVEIGNGVDASAFASAGPVESLDGPYFVYAGTASEVHGAGIFADAFRSVAGEHPDVRLVFIGQGADRTELEGMVADLPVGSVRFLPRLAPQRVAAWLRGAVAALASVRPGVGYDFAFPTKIYAAIGVGTPVIYAGLGPGRDFVASGPIGQAVGYDVAAVADAMSAALAAPPDRARRSEVAAWALAHATASERPAEQAVTAITAAVGR
jgi:glycosyltransferase involved in cell wall biosynthesis